MDLPLPTTSLPLIAGIAFAAALLWLAMQQAGPGTLASAATQPVAPTTPLVRATALPATNPEPVPAANTAHAERRAPAPPPVAPDLPWPQQLALPVASLTAAEPGSTLDLATPDGAWQVALTNQRVRRTERGATLLEFTGTSRSGHPARLLVTARQGQLHGRLAVHVPGQNITYAMESHDGAVWMHSEQALRQRWQPGRSDTLEQ